MGRFPFRPPPRPPTSCLKTLGVSLILVANQHLCGTTVLVLSDGVWPAVTSVACCIRSASSKGSDGALIGITPTLLSLCRSHLEHLVCQLHSFPHLWSSGSSVPLIPLSSPAPAEKKLSLDSSETQQQSEHFAQL